MVSKLNVVRLLLVVSGLLLAGIVILFNPVVFGVVLVLAGIGYACLVDKDLFKELVIRAFPILIITRIYRWVMASCRDGE